MRNFIFLLLGLITINCTYSQTFERNITGYFFNPDFPGRNIRITNDRDYLIAGKTAALDGTNMIVLTKFSDSGYQLWTKNYETGAYVNYHVSMEESVDGGYIISATGPYEIRLIKTDSDGDEVWTKTISIDKYEDKNPVVLETDSADFIIAGTRTLGPESNYKRIIAFTKINSDGEIVTEKNIGEETHLTLQFIKEIKEDGYIIGGYLGFPYPEGSYLYIAKLDEKGNLVWKKGYEDVKTVLNSNVNQTKNNQFIIVGTFRSSNTFQDRMFLMCIDEEGNVIWKRTHFGDMTRGYDVEKTYDNGFVVAGSTAKYGNGQYDLLILKTNAIGDSSWIRMYGGAYSDYGYEIQQTADSGYIVDGYSESFSQNFSYLIRTNKDGDVTCRSDHKLFYIPRIKAVSTVTASEMIRVSYEHRFGDAEVLLYKESVIPGEYILVNTQETGKIGNIYDTTAIPGKRSYRYKIRAINECGDTSLSSLTHRSVFLEVYDGGNNTRNLVWNHYEGVGIASYVILKGSDKNNLATIDTIPGSINIYSDTSRSGGTEHYQIMGILSSSGSDNESYKTYSNISYLVKVSVSDKSQVHSNMIKIYPNPVYGQSTIEFSNPGDDKYSCHVFDAHGREIRKYSNIRSSSFVFNKEELTSGIYFLELRGPKTFRTKILVK